MRYTLLLILLLVAPNCGFKPIHDNGVQSVRFKQTIKIDTPTNENEFLIREHLFRLLGKSIENRYLLSFSTNILSTTGIVTKQNQTTRYILNSTTNYQIKDISTGSIIFTGTVFGNSSYSSNINTTNYSSDISRQNSIERLSKFTAEKIVAEIEVLGVD